MKSLRLYVFCLIITILAIEVILFMLPLPRHIVDAQSYKTSFLVVSLFSAFYFAAGLLFLFGIKDFRPEVRKSYAIITASMAFFGLVNLQYPILIYSGLIPGVWTAYGWSLLIIIPGVIMQYWGVRHIAQTLEIKNKITTVWILLACLVLSSILVMFIPHLKEIPELWFSVHQISAVVNLIINVFTAVILLAVLRVIGPSYLASLKWFITAVILSILGFLHVIIAALFGQNNEYTNQGTTAAPFIIVATFYFISGYYFCKIRFYGLQKDAVAKPGHDIVDAIVTIASLVSYKKDIDPMIEQMRSITAKLNPGEALSSSDQDTLAVIYLSIENYLINDEKLKKFTKQSLRVRLSVGAIHVIEQHEHA